MCNAIIDTPLLNNNIVNIHFLKWDPKGKSTLRNDSVNNRFNI